MSPPVERTTQAAPVASFRALFSADEERRGFLRRWPHQPCDHDRPRPPAQDLPPPRSPLHRSAVRRRHRRHGARRHHRLGPVPAAGRRGERIAPLQRGVAGARASQRGPRDCGGFPSPQALELLASKKEVRSVVSAPVRDESCLLRSFSPQMCFEIVATALLVFTVLCASDPERGKRGALSVHSRIIHICSRLFAAPFFGSGRVSFHCSRFHLLWPPPECCRPPH